MAIATSLCSNHPPMIFLSLARNRVARSLSIINLTVSGVLGAVLAYAFPVFSLQRRTGRTRWGHSCGI